MIRQLFRVTEGYDNPLDQQRANGLIAIAWLMVGSLAVWLAVIAAPALIAGVGFSSVILPGVIIAVALILLLVLLQGQRLNAAAWLFVGLLLVLTAPPALGLIPAPFEALSGPMSLVVPLVAAGLLLDRRGLSLVAVLVLGAVGLRAYLAVNVPDSTNVELQTSLVILIVVAALLLVLGGHVDRALARMERERAVLRASAGYVETLNRARDEVELLAATVQLIRDDMGYSDARIYTVVDGTLKSVVRPGLTSDGRKESNVDREVITQLFATRAPVVSTLGNDFRQRLTAPNQTAVTVPVTAGDRLVAAIDVHTVDAGFSLGELEGIRRLAAQLSVQLAELRLVEDLQRTIREQEAALSAMPRRAPAPRQGRAPSRVTTVTSGFDLTTRDGTSSVSEDSAWTPDLVEAAQLSEPRVEREGTTQRLLLPIRHGDETLGAMTFDIPTDRPLGERELALARLVSERLGQAVENARLFEQNQTQAEREHKATEVANALISATDVRAVLALAAESFNEAMGAVATRVTLQPDSTESARREHAEGVTP